MNKFELLEYVGFAVGSAYVIGLGFAAYLSFRHGLPVFGMPAPPRIPAPPSTSEQPSE